MPVLVTLTFQLDVYAVDLGVPPHRTGPMEVVINVNRNRNTPRFNPEGTYSKDIKQDAKVGSEVLRVQATDEDEEVCASI